MWRLHGFFGRVLHRCPVSAPLRLTQSHHAEDEVVSGSILLSSSLNASDGSSQRRGEDGGQRRRQKTSRFCYTELPRYTALDAVGWGAAAALFMQICKRVHSQLSSVGPEAGASGPGHLATATTTATTLHKCGYRVLLEILSPRDVLPRARGVMCLHMLPERPEQAHDDDNNNNSTSTSTSSSTNTNSSSTNTNTTSNSSSSSSSSNNDLEHLSFDISLSDHQAADLSQDSSLPENQSQILSTSSHLEQNHPQGDDDKEVASGEERLAEATSNLRDVEDASIAVVLNIIGLETAQSQDCEAAFSCFVAAARHGYGKAQFNAGVCLEKGRGVAPDAEKALQYYWQAASGGHTQAQYRYARLLLTSRGQHSPQEWSTAVRLLEQAADAGLTQAQVFLGSVFAQEAVLDARKSVHYLRMAAESSDGRALLHLGQCYAHGFGVQRNATAAAGLYARAAQAGNGQAQRLLRLLREDEAALRSIRSAPCFSVFPRLPLSPPSTTSTSTLTPSPTPRPHLSARLPHSWSTGSLASTTTTPPLHLHLHLHTLGPSPGGGVGGGPCGWTLGV